jgi:hypothetical protein
MALVVVVASCGVRAKVEPARAAVAPAKAYLIHADVDAGGLPPFWDAGWPNLHRLAREGLFGFSREIPPRRPGGGGTFAEAAAAWRRATAAAGEPPDVFSVSIGPGALDRGVGVLLEAIAASGHAASTSLVITLHGEPYAPTICAGPAFITGVIESPIDPDDLAPTVRAAAGLPPLPTAPGVPLRGFLPRAGNPAEVVSLPENPRQARDLVLLWAGHAGKTPVLHDGPAQGVVLIDVAGLRTSHLEEGLPIPRALMSLLRRGSWMTDMRLRWLDGPASAHEMLTGGAQPAVHDETLFQAARALGLATGAFGATDEALGRLSLAGIDEIGDARAIDGFLQATPRGLAYLAVDEPGDPVAAANAALMAVERALGERRDDWLIVVTSHGVPAGTLAPDAHGDARRVPLLLVGVRANIREHILVTGTASPADLAPTLLFALGAQPRAPDLERGVQLDGGLGPRGIRHPIPDHAFEGRVLLQAFHVD